MQWTSRGPSRNVEDRRGQRTSFGGGRGGLRLGFGGLVVVGLLSVVFQTDLFAVLEGSAPIGAPGTTEGPLVSPPGEEQEVAFLSFVLDDVQTVWPPLLRGVVPYREAKLVLFRDAVRTGCGDADSGVGPFYCPLDERVYLDLSFFAELHQKYAAPGDFAQAYVLAHEIGHHVQHVLGIDERMRARQQSSPAVANALSVDLELQADCLAGVWGHSAAQRGLLDTGDVAEGLAAAAAVGDDRLQKQSGRRVSPESFTHGSSEARVRWFRRGLDAGALAVCATFDGEMAP